MAEFYEMGKRTKTVNVTISYRIIKLFSEGLYSSPNKAIEELVCNAFDADAHKVHVVLSPDLQGPDASIAIVDDGESMDYGGMSEHWIIGRSLKEAERITKGRRKRIGKFGIGKLATYVLADRLTHICKKGGKYYSATMDYTSIPGDSSSGVFESKRGKETVSLPFRELTENEAQEALAPWIKGGRPGYRAIKLFGKGAVESWTVAIMSELKEMIANLKRGRLKWVLQTAMPLRDDFQLYLDGERIQAQQYGKPQKKWVIGKDITEKHLEKTGLDDLLAIEDASVPDKDLRRHGLSEPSLGRMVGYVELHDDRLDVGKAAHLFRSNGFFIYAHGRLINEDDGHFGIGSNELSHGTFARFRAVIHADTLDEELRSSRETVRECVLVENFRNVLKAVFNVVRREWTKREDELSPGARFSKTLRGTPNSLTQRPLVSLLTLALEGTISPRYLKYPLDLSKGEKEDYLQSIVKRIEDQENLIQALEVQDLAVDEKIALFDIDTGTLIINRFHPFVAHFLDEYEDVKTSLPLELLAMSEVLLEANLHQMGIEAHTVDSIMDLRDELLRTLGKSTGRRNAFVIAQALCDAATNQDELEIEVVAAFNSMGFEAIRVGGNGRPDGTATAILGVDEDERPQRYKVSLEAKSKEKEGTKVANSGVRISTVARHRDAFGCDHAIVIGPDFPSGDGTALASEIRREKKQTGKTVTVMRIHDLARLVRLRPLRRIGPLEIRGLMKECLVADECKNWVDKVEAKKVQVPRYKDVLEVIWERQKKRCDESVEYGVVALALEHRKITYPKKKVIDICSALEGMTPEYIACRPNGTVELRQKPEIVLERIKAETGKYPEGEIGGSFLRNV